VESATGAWLQRRLPTQHKSPPEIRGWAHVAYPRIVAGWRWKDIDRNDHRL
jgi:hypothetical protein